LPVSSTRVRTSINVAARAYGYVANEISHVFLEVINGFGLDPDEYLDSLPVIENGLRLWLATQQIQAAYLEVYDSVTGRVRARVDLDLVLTQTGGEHFETAIDSVKAAAAEAGRFPGCSYRMVVATVNGAANVRGWSDTTLGSVDHLTSYNVGEVIKTAVIGTQMTIHR
jgi:HORMA domain-containing protein